MWVRLHLPVLLGVAGSLVAGWFEWTRALAGRQVAWVYAGEWPLFAVLGIVIWWRLWREELDARRTRLSPDPATGVERTAVGSAAAGSAAAGTTFRSPALGDGADADLLAWQDYLARLHAVDPPGGPAPRCGHGQLPTNGQSCQET